MGLFDEIKCEFPLPDLKPEEGWIQTATFQSKSLDPSLETYTITKDGRLILNKITWDIISPKDRKNNDPFPELTPIANPPDDIDTEYHGDIIFYTGEKLGEHNYVWHEFKARFTDGKVAWIKRIYQDDDPSKGSKIF